MSDCRDAISEGYLWLWNYSVEMSFGKRVFAWDLAMMSNGNPIPIDQYHAVLRMLIRRATFMDKWRARRLGGFWLNAARKELLIHNATETPGLKD